MKRYILILSLLCIGLNAKILEVNQLFNKKLVKVIKKNISTSKTFYANTNFDETKVKDITIRFDGFIKDLQANEEHKYIKKNQKLFSIYSQEIVSIFEELILAIKFNRKSNIKSIQRKLKLLDVNPYLIKQIKNNKKIPYYIDVYSKYKGIIINKKIYDGGYIKQGQTVFKIVDISTIWVDANIYQKDLAFIKKNMKVLVYIQGHNTINAKVDFIHPFMDKKTKTIKVRIKIDNKDLKIYPNLFAKVKFLKDKKSMLIIPKTAVVIKGDKYYVFNPVEDNQFEPVEVKLKRINNNSFEVLSGIDESQTIIDNALFLLDSDAITNGLYDSQEDDEW